MFKKLLYPKKIAYFMEVGGKFSLLRVYTLKRMPQEVR
jgi:hypothetical protein